MVDAMRRRGFVRACAASAAWLSGVRYVAANDLKFNAYERVQITTTAGAPLRASDVAQNRSLVFNYPYVSTPCFLLNLGTPLNEPITLRTEAGATYTWLGGVGRDASVVAFAAICAHKLSHPAKSVSFINFRSESVAYYDHQQIEQQREQVIYCCSEKSVYDPKRGAAVLGGPAKQPLATVVLEVDGDDQLFAVGMLGGELYDAYFEKFGFRLALESRTQDIKSRSFDVAPAIPIDEYSRSQMLCG